MANDTEKTSFKDKIDIARISLAVLGLVEKLAIGVLWGIAEFARIKKNKAENEAATAKAELATIKKSLQVDKENENKKPSDIIDEFLAGK